MLIGISLLKDKYHMRDERYWLIDETHGKFFLDEQLEQELGIFKLGSCDWNSKEQCKVGTRRDPIIYTYLLTFQRGECFRNTFF